MTLDLSHLHALELRLSHERERLTAATAPAERELRAGWIAQIEREIAGEYAFLGITAAPVADMSDDDLLAALDS